METLDLESNSKIKVIGFDLDGTLYPLTDEIQGRIRGKIYEKVADAFNLSFEKAKKIFEEEYAKLMSGSRTIERIAGKYGKNINGSDIVQESLQEANILDLIKPNPELVEMLCRISKTRGLDLLTGSEYDFAIEKLNRVGIGVETFRNILPSQDGSKTNGELYEKWLGLRGLPPIELLYVGDNKKQDIDSPKRLGIRTCIVGEYGEADFQIADILQLEQILAGTE